MKTSPSALRYLSSVVSLPALAPVAHRPRTSALCLPAPASWHPSSLVGFPIMALALCALLFATSVRAADTAPAALPEVDHWVYLAELPDPAELSQNAAANGLTVQRIDHKADTLVITYKYPDGVVGTMGYKLLNAVSSANRVIGKVTTVSSPSTTTVVERTVIEREPEIVYVDRTPRTRVVYREPDNFWLPLTVGLGIGYITGHNSHHHYRPYYSGHYRSHRSHYSHRGHHGRR